MKAPFYFTVKINTFPNTSGNTWGALIGIGINKYIPKKVINVYDDQTNYLINLREARKVNGNG